MMAKVQAMVDDTGGCFIILVAFAELTSTPKKHLPLDDKSINSGVDLGIHSTNPRVDENMIQFWDTFPDS